MPVLVLNYLAVSEADVELYIVGDAHMTCSTWIDAELHG